MLSTERTQLVAEYILQGHTLQEAGDLFHISRERVRQLLVRAKISYRYGKDNTPTKKAVARRIRICPICNRKYISLLRTNAQRIISKEEKLLDVRAHCRKYKHPMPDVSDWQRSRKIVNDYKKGMSAIEVVRKYSIPHPEMLYHYLNQWHVKPRYDNGAYESWIDQPVGRNEVLQREVAEATKTMTHKEVAQKYGISEPRVGQLKKKFANEEST